MVISHYQYESLQQPPATRDFFPDYAIAYRNILGNAYVVTLFRTFLPGADYRNGKIIGLGAFCDWAPRTDWILAVVCSFYVSYFFFICYAMSTTDQTIDPGMNWTGNVVIYRRWYSDIIRHEWLFMLTFFYEYTNGPTSSVLLFGNGFNAPIDISK